MKAIDQVIDSGQTILLRYLSQVSIASGCGGARMAEQALNMAQAQAPFEQMGRKTVTKGMD